MKLDLRREFSEVYDHLVSQIRQFDPRGRNVLGPSGPVRIVHVGFEYSQAGWLLVVFDTRPNANPDGEWTKLIKDENLLSRPLWLEAGEANSEDEIEVVDTDGSEATLPPGEELAEVLGPMIKAAVLQLRSEGGFAGLPKQAGCELCIEHFSGAFGWPAYKKRGKENLAVIDAKGK